MMTMKVWIALFQDNEERYIIGVYSYHYTKDEIRKMIALEFGEDNEYVHEFELEEWEVKL